MQRTKLLSIVLVAVMLVPVASAAVPTGNSAPAQGEPAAALPATETGGSAGGSGAGSGGTAASEDGNYTRLYIEDGYRNAELKPGESTTFEVTVGNSEDHAVELDPHVVLPQVEGRPIQKSWVTIEDANTTLDAGEERTFTVTVEVPDDAELGRYHAQVAFTNETIAYEGRPARPVHAARMSLEVFEEPSITIRSDRYRSAQVQAGESYTYEIVVNNTGDETVPLNPTLKTEDRHHRRGGQNTVERAWFDIEAPSEVAPGENATVTVTVTPPESASVGDYDAEVDLGLKDPARPRHDTYWQQVGLHFRVWQQPEEPFETTVQVSERADNVTLTLEAGQYGPSASDDPVSFDVAFVAPNGTTVDHERVRVANRGGVSLGEDDPRADSQGPYSSRGEHRQFVYRVDDPPAGEWTVEIMPHNTTDFRYEIVREES